MEDKTEDPFEFSIVQIGRRSWFRELTDKGMYMSDSVRHSVMIRKRKRGKVQRRESRL